MEYSRIYFFIDNNMNTLVFRSSLDIIHGELFRNPERKNKFIPVYLDHCSLQILPPTQVTLQTYKIPSKIDDLVFALMGETIHQPNTQWPLLELDDISAKANLNKAVYKLKKNHQRRCQKNFGR